MPERFGSETAVRRWAPKQVRKARFLLANCGQIIEHYQPRLSVSRLQKQNRRLYSTLPALFRLELFHPRAK